MRYHLGRSQVREAVTFASHYQNLVFFAHALEILLHNVLESDADHTLTVRGADTDPDVLPVVVEFLDHFDVALEVVVGCARKTEMARWNRLFDIVGDPRALFEVSPSVQSQFIFSYSPSLNTSTNFSSPSRNASNPPN